MEINKFYAAVDGDKSEWLYDIKPERTVFRGKKIWTIHNSSMYTLSLPIGTIKKIAGREITYNDDPIEVKLTLKNYKL